MGVGVHKPNLHVILDNTERYIEQRRLPVIAVARRRQRCGADDLPVPCIQHAGIIDRQRWAGKNLRAHTKDQKRDDGQVGFQNDLMGSVPFYRRV